MGNIGTATGGLTSNLKFITKDENFVIIYLISFDQYTF